MKKSFLTLLVIFTTLSVFGQTAIEIQKAKSACSAYLKRNLNNPSSYQPSSWSKLKKTYTAFEDTKKVKRIDDILESFTNGKDALQGKIWDAKRRADGDYTQDSTYKYYVNMQNEVNLSTDSLNALRSSLEKSYKPIFDGYSIEHSFRARNKFNALVLQNHIFILNKTFKVISSGDTEELERQRQDLQRRIDELTNKKY
ncbi:hypothetical protein [Pedobacter nyackensis]|uniref:hypothetical protein n=1 Tax=Pedobacter nyackensis TaxID=475255 RepID=UPI00292F0CC0|nr:hypothetical protein [Pedobacter nyackensis]